MRPFHAIPVTLIALAVALISSAGTSTAGSIFIVDRLDDTSPIPSACTAAANDCSFRGAVEAANTSGGADTIMVPPGTHTLALAGSGEDLNQTGDVDVLESVTISGAGAGTSSLDADGIDRALDVYPALAIGYVEIRDLTITGGVLTGFSDAGGGVRVGSGDVLLADMNVTDNSAELRGGGIFQDEYANLTLNNVNVVNNSAVHAIQGTSGGGLHKADGVGYSLEITGSLFQGNTADEGGGLTIGVSSSATLDDTTLIGNVATQGSCSFCLNGGGGLNIPATDVDFSDGVISGNTSLGGGGGVLALGDIRLSGTTVFDNTAQWGGGLWTGFGSTVTDSLFVENTASVHGGGLRIAGTPVSDTTITGNTTPGDGGGIHGYENTITGSTVTNNTADRGGGIFGAGSTNSLTNTTISGNTATTAGGGIFKDDVPPLRVPAGLPPPGDTPLSHVTLTGNSAPSGANAATASASGPLTFTASIVANPIGPASCSGNVLSGGQNFDEAGSCGLSHPSDQSGPDALLAPLTENGGPTQTHALLAGSPAIDLVTTGCPPPATDQRGSVRPNGAACDAGALESSLAGPTTTASPTTSPTPSPTPSPTASPGGGEARIWADNNCSSDVNPVDSLITLRADAGLSTNTGECPEMGEVVDVALASPHPWGDADCSGEISPVDSLKILRHDAGLSVTQEEGCPAMGADVMISPI